MSIGRPQSFSDLVSAPPDRGSFPLDHYGAFVQQLSRRSRLTCTLNRSLNDVGAELVLSELRRMQRCYESLPRVPSSAQGDVDAMPR